MEIWNVFKSANGQRDRASEDRENAYIDEMKTK